MKTKHVFLPGQVVNSWTIFSQLKKGHYEVVCKCGTPGVVCGHGLANGRSKSCGCETPNRIRYAIGQIVGGRKVVRKVTKESNGCLLVECLKCSFQASVRGHQAKSKCMNCEPHYSDSMKNGVVYALICPFTGDVRYVGATRVGIAERLRRHIKARNRKIHASAPVYVWISEVVKNGGRPGIITLETVSDGTLSEREVFWVKKLSSDGTQLLNVAYNMKPKQEADHAA